MPNRVIQLDDTMSVIPLTRGKFAIVDKEDFERLWAIEWCYSPRKDASDSGYAMAAIRVHGRYKTALMHRFILGNPSVFVDHINGNGLDNRKCNLRLATNQQNQFNSRANRGKRFKGVSLKRGNRTKPWHAHLRKDGTLLFLGYHNSQEDAARAYDKAAIEHYGRFARLNFPSEAPSQTP